MSDKHDHEPGPSRGPSGEHDRIGEGDERLLTNEELDALFTGLGSPAAPASQSGGDESLLTSEDIDALFAKDRAQAGAAPEQLPPVPTPPSPAVQPVEEVDAPADAAVVAESDPSTEDARLSSIRQFYEGLGIVPGVEVTVLPSHGELVRFINDVKQGLRPPTPSVSRRILESFSYDPDSDTYTLMFEDGSALAQSGALSRLKPINLSDEDRNSLLTFDSNGDACTVFAEIDGYQIGVTESGAIRYSAPAAALSEVPPVEEHIEDGVPPEEDPARRPPTPSRPAPPLPRPSVAPPREPRDLPVYFQQALVHYFNDPETYERWSRAATWSERRSIISELYSSAGEGWEEIDPDLERTISETAQMLAKLTDDAALHLEPNTYDRVAKIADFLPGVWRQLRLAGMTEWASQGSKIAQIGKSVLLGAVTGGLMRSAAGAFSSATKLAVPGLAAVGATVAGISFGNQRFRKLESAWLKPPTDAVAPGERDYPGAWVSNLETADLAQRVAEARLYLTRRETQSGSRKASHARGEEIHTYELLVHELVNRAGSPAVSQLVAETESALKQTTSQRQVGQAAVHGLKAGAATYLVGYFARDALKFVASHIWPDAGAEAPSAQHGAAPAKSAPTAPAPPAVSAPAASAAPVAPAPPVVSAPPITPTAPVPSVETGPTLALDPHDGLSAQEIHSVGAKWVGAHTPEAAPSVADAELADHYVRSDIAAKLGLWKEDGNGSGHLLGNWKGEYEVVGNKTVYVQHLVDPKPVGGVDLTSVKIVDGKLDLSGIKIDTANSLTGQLNNGAWAKSWAEFRTDQLIHALDSDAKIASLSGFPVETLSKANPELLQHLRQQMVDVVKAQMNPQGAMPKLGDHLVSRVNSSTDILSSDVVGRQLHAEAQNWANQHGVELIDRPAPLVSAPASAPAHVAAPERVGYQGWGGRQAVATSQPGEPGYRGWGGDHQPVPAKPVSNVPHLATEHGQSEAPQIVSKPEPPIGQPAPEPEAISTGAVEQLNPSASDSFVEPKVLPGADQMPVAGLPVTQPGETLGDAVKPLPPIMPGEVLGDAVKPILPAK